MVRHLRVETTQTQQLEMSSQIQLSQPSEWLMTPNKWKGGGRGKERKRERTNVSPPIFRWEN